MTVSQSVVVLTSLDEVHASKESWLDLEKTARFKGLFNSYNWVETWARHYATYIEKLLIFTYWKQGELASILPLYVSVSNKHKAFYISSSEPSHIETCSEAQDFLSASEEEVIPHSAFVESLKKHGVHSVEFNNLSPHSLLLQWSRNLSGYQTVKEERYRFYVDLPDGIDRLEKRTRRYRKTASRAEVAIERVTNINEFEKVFNALIELNSKRWLDKAKPAIFKEKTFCEFHRELAKNSLADNTLSLYFLRFEHRIIAVNYSFVSGNTIVFYQSGNDTSFKPNVSPGTLLHYAQALEAVSRGKEIYDFMSSGQQEGYKAQLTSTCEAVLSFTLHTSLLNYAMHNVIERIKTIKAWGINRVR